MARHRVLQRGLCGPSVVLRFRIVLKHIVKTLSLPAYHCSFLRTKPCHKILTESQHNGTLNAGA